LYRENRFDCSILTGIHKPKLLHLNHAALHLKNNLEMDKATLERAKAEQQKQQQAAEQRQYTNVFIIDKWRIQRTR